MSAAEPAAAADLAERIDPPIGAARRFLVELAKSAKGLTGFVLIAGVVFVALFEIGRAHV